MRDAGVSQRRSIQEITHDPWKTQVWPSPDIEVRGVKNESYNSEVSQQKTLKIDGLEDEISLLGTMLNFLGGGVGDP